MFDTQTNEWEEICDMNTSVSRHSACTIGNKIIINTFRNVLVIENNQLQDKQTTGDSPVGLSMSACVPMGSHVLIIGGTDKNQSMHSEIFALNTKNWKWTKFSSDMKPRAGLCAAPINNSSCLVFGGAGLDSNYDGGKGLVAYNDTFILTAKRNKFQMTKVTTPVIPTQRVGASLNKYMSKFVLHGGWNPTTKETYSETLIIE